MNVLLIANHFAPEISGGVGRPISLRRYLPGLGLEVTVVTVNAYGKAADEEGVFRFNSFIDWRKRGITLKKVCKILTLPYSKTIGICSDLYWLLHAWRGIRILFEQKRFDLVYSTFPGIETLILGLHVSKKYRIPLVTEFRDGLKFDSVMTYLNPLQLKRAFKVEERLVERSQLVITIGHNLTDYFIREYPGIKCETIFNGYEADEFISLFVTKKREGTETVLAIFGGLDSTKKANRDGLFIALRNVVERERSGKIVILMMGRYGKEEKNRIETLAGKQNIRFMPMLQKKEGLLFIKENADYLVFYGIPGQTTVISSKIFDYIMIGKPIVGICAGNEAEDIIKITRTGEVCGFDVESIEALLEKAIKQDFFYSPDEQAIALFNRKSQAERIAQLLTKMIKNSSCSSHSP